MRRDSARREDRSIAAIEYQSVGLIAFVILMFIITGFRYPVSVYSSPKISSEISTDKEIYQMGDSAIVQGHIQFFTTFQDVIIKLYIFDWSDSSTILLIKTKLKISHNDPIYLRDINQGEPIKWVCNKTGEFGIKIYLEKENDPSTFRVSFISRAHFIVIDEKIFIDIYTDRLIYIESQIVQVFGKIISKEYFEDVNIEITLRKGDELIQKLCSESQDLLAGNEINLNLSFSSRDQVGDLYVYLKLISKDPGLLDSITKFTKIQVRNKESVMNLKEKLITKYELLQDHPDFLLTLCDTGHYISGFSDEDERLLEYLINGYHQMSEAEKVALFILPSYGCSYITTGDLIYWLIADFAKATGLLANDTRVFLSYAAVFDDFFIRQEDENLCWETYAFDQTKERMLDWIKEYMIGQCQFFGAEKLREVVEKHGVFGLMEVIYPNFNERFGDLKYQFIPLDAYKEAKKFAESTVYNNLTIQRILTDHTPPKSIDEIQSFIWSEILSEYGSSGAEPTTKGFYDCDVAMMLAGEKFPGDCVTVSRLVALICRSMTFPVGIIKTGESLEHWGNYQIHGGEIVPDTQTQNIFNHEKLSNKEKFIIKWPSLHNFNSHGYGIDELYREKYGDELPEFYPKMELETFLSVISLEMVDAIEDFHDPEWFSI